MCNTLIRIIDITITVKIHHVFVLATLKILSTSYFEISNYSLLAIVIFWCYRLLEVIPPIQQYPCVH